MADFLIALKITANNEGGWNDTKSDSGGETIFGISRNNWNSWGGWGIVDSYKNKPNFPQSVNQNQQLIELANKFYKTNFWDVNKLDQINDQQIANNVYDFGVNSGVGRAAKTLQKVMGTLVVDGIIGNATISTVNGGNAQNIYNTYNIARGEFYNSIAKGSQAQFLHSWLSRLIPYKA